MKSFKPMLAPNEKTDTSKIKYPVLASAKLDGVRAIVKDGKLLSRSLKPIPNEWCQRLFSNLPEGTDGELILGSPYQDPYRRTVSAVMSEDGQPAVQFYVFDRVMVPETFQERQADLNRRPWPAEVVLVNQTWVESEKELLDLENIYVGLGYEGLMVRSLDGPYKFGRATQKEGYLLKVKRFLDSEAIILGCYEQMHNDNEAKTNELGRTERSTKKDGLVPAGILGGFEVKDVKTGVEFSVGSGFTLSDRENFWKRRKGLTGKIIKYKFFPTGSKEKPRFPGFLGFRDKRDM